MRRGRAGDGGALSAEAPREPGALPLLEGQAGPLPLIWRMRALGTAFVLLPLLEWVSFARLERALQAIERWVPASPVSAPSAGRWLDRWLARLPGPWHFTCLRRAVVLYHLLRAAGEPLTLCIGVRRDPDGSLHAHAWLLREQALFLEPASNHARVAGYAEIARFPSLVA